MKLKNGGMLLLTAFIWGTAFVAQSVGMDHLGPFSFNGIRCLIGAVALLPCIWFFNRMNKDPETDCSEKEKSGKDLITGGVACGVLLFTASSLQQAGIQYTTAGKAGFITAFYIVIVPVLGIFLHEKNSMEGMDGGVTGTCRIIFFVYYGVFFCWKRRCSGIFVCTCFFRAYSGNRSFFSKSGWCEDVLYPVFREWNSVITSYVCAGDTKACICGGCMDAASVCRCIILRGCIYITDTWTEECESGGSISDFKPGILLFSACGLDHTWRTFVIQRIVRMHTDVSGNYTGTASG